MQWVWTRPQAPARFGHLGLRELIEPQMRRLVAEQLGASEEWLRPEVSLVQDLAVDSLDLTQLVVEVEDCFGVSIPEQVTDRVRTYGDLVDIVVDARLAVDGPSVPSVFIRAAVVPAKRDARGRVTRTAWLSPYTVEAITADARRAGGGATLTITVPAGAERAEASRVERCFAHLGSLGVAVDVQYDQPHRRRAVA